MRLLPLTLDLWAASLAAVATKSGGGGRDGPEHDVEVDSLDEGLFRLPLTGIESLPGVGPGERMGLPPAKVAPDGEVLGELLDADACFRSEGVEHFSAFEMWHLPKHRTPRTVAIPQRVMWPWWAWTTLHGVEPVRRHMGRKMSVRGFRPPAYNAAVGGAPNSMHLDCAFDVRLVREPGESDRSFLSAKREMCMFAARRFWEFSHDLKMGGGVYGTKRQPHHFHVDLGWKRRSWGVMNSLVRMVKP